MEVIGIHGQARAGKDTICQTLEVAFPFVKFKKQSFADLLKVSAASALGFDNKWLDGSWQSKINLMDEFKVSGKIEISFDTYEDISEDYIPIGTTMRKTISGREYLQNYGTEAHRELFGDDFWIKQVLEDSSLRYDNVDVLIIPDVRFDNEAYAIKGSYESPNGTLWKVERETGEAKTGHVSEQELEADWDYVFDNNGDLAHLRIQVEEAFQPLLEEIKANA